ncbi:hypothetical protein C3L33_06053, partial [Rhododendron williamsianum]
MRMKAVRVDTESPTCRLEDLLSRITYTRAPKGWMLVQTDAGFVKEPKEGGRVISVGAFVFFDELGSIRYYDTVVLSWVSNEKEAEFETIKFVMYEAVRIDIKKLSVCTDNFEILKAIQRSLPMKLLEDYSFIYLSREGNAVADLLAKWRMAMTHTPHKSYYKLAKESIRVTTGVLYCPGLFGMAIDACYAFVMAIDAFFGL